MSTAEEQIMKKCNQIVKEVTSKKFVKVIISPKCATQGSKPKATNGTNMNC